MTIVIPNGVQNPPVAGLLTRKDPDMLPVIPAGVPGAARPADRAGPREDDRAQPRLLLHIACPGGGQIPTGLPTHYLCGAPVRLLLGAIAPGDGPDGPGVCPICAALDHPGRPPGQTGKDDYQRIRRPAWRVPAACWHVGAERTGHDPHCRADE